MNMYVVLCILCNEVIVSKQLNRIVFLKSVSCDKSNLEEREEGFKCDASIRASFAVSGLHLVYLYFVFLFCICMMYLYFVFALHQLLHVPLRRVLAQRAQHVPHLGHL